MFCRGGLLVSQVCFHQEIIYLSNVDQETWFLHGTNTSSIICITNGFLWKIIAGIQCNMFCNIYCNIIIESYWCHYMINAFCLLYFVLNSFHNTRGLVLNIEMGLKPLMVLLAWKFGIYVKPKFWDIFFIKKYRK